MATQLVISIVLSAVISLGYPALLWYKQVPDYYDPCTIVVIGPKKGDMVDVAPVPTLDCIKGGGLTWYGSFGRVHIHLDYNLDKNETKNFEICLVSGAEGISYVWHDKRKTAWEPLTFQIGPTAVVKRDMCRISKNGSMDLYLEPIWAFGFYHAFLSWNVTFVREEDIPIEVELPRDPKDRIKWVDDQGREVDPDGNVIEPDPEEEGAKGAGESEGETGEREAEGDNAGSGSEEEIKSSEDKRQNTTSS